MGFCIKCGRKLQDDDLFCPKCGTPNENAVESGPAVESASAAVPAAEPVTAPADKEASIALADKLFKEYKDFERLNKEIGDVKIRLSTPVENTPRLYSAFRFFWPFLIYSAIAFTLLSTVARIIVYSSVEAGIFFLILSLLSIPILLITGGVRAVRLRDELNTGVYSDLSRRREQQKTDKQNSEALFRKRDRAMESLRKYDSIVPRDLRNSSSMNKIKALLQSNKVENFAEAIELIK